MRVRHGPGAERRGGALRLAAIASVAAHVAIVVLTIRLLPVPPDPPSEGSLELAVEVRAPAPPAQPPEGAASTEAAPAATPPPVATPRRRRPHSTRTSAMPSPGTVAPAPTPAPSEGNPTPDGRECPAPAVPTVSLDPRSVALRAVLGEPSAPSGGPPGPRDGPNVSALDRSLRTFNQRQVDGPARPPPRLQKLPDGGYAYRDRRLSAHISPDGRLSFSTTGVIAGTRVNPGTHEDLSSGRQAVGFEFRPSFDINDALASAGGEDPLRVEKEWFLRETQELRDELATRTRATEGFHAMGALRRQLEEIVADRILSPARKREAIFEVWDDCATDAMGGRARRMIEQFIRDQMPGGSILAYSDAELERLNARRVTTARFAPYRNEADPGAPS